MRYFFCTLLILLPACTTRPVPEPTITDCINSIEVKFSEDVTVDPNALVLTGNDYGAVDIADFSYAEGVAVWTFIPPLPCDRYKATFLAAKITDKAGNNLAGDRTVIIYDTDDGFRRLVDDWLLQVGENDRVNLTDFAIFARR